MAGFLPVVDLPGAPYAVVAQDGLCLGLARVVLPSVVHGGTEGTIPEVPAHVTLDGAILPHADVGVGGYVVEQDGVDRVDGPTDHAIAAVDVGCVVPSRLSHVEPDVLPHGLGYVAVA